MNSLSWMIYLADVAGSIGNIGTLVMIGAGVGGLVSIFLTAGRVDWANIGKRDDDRLPAMKTGWESGKGYFKVAIIAGAILIPFPSSETIYAIAASEIGEDALKSETGGKAVKALNAWLDRQIAGEAEAE